VNIKSQDAIATKWAARASGAQADYTTGVQTTQKSWAQNTAAAASNYVAGVQQAVADKRFESGVTEAGDAAWKKGAIEKGGTRYSQGVNGAKTKFQQGFSRFASALAGAPLPPRFPKGDPQNGQRVAFVNNLLRQVKLGRA
jgi:uncharacterized phage infection (PIP) family protein YhgE